MTAAIKNPGLALKAGNLALKNPNVTTSLLRAAQGGKKKRKRKRDQGKLKRRRIIEREKQKERKQNVLLID